MPTNTNIKREYKDEIYTNEFLTKLSERITELNTLKLVIEMRTNGVEKIYPVTIESELMKIEDVSLKIFSSLLKKPIF